MKDARHSLGTGSGREPMIFRGFDFAFARRSFRSLFRTAAAASAVLLLAVGARAGTIDFGTGLLPLGPLGPSVTIGGIVIDGFWFDGGVWSSPAELDLFRRDETNDHGLGVCNPDETCTTPGGGDINELDNLDNPELIRLTLPAGYSWVSVGVSSLDNNTDDESIDDDERGQAFASDNAAPALGIGGTPFEMFEGGVDTNVNPIEFVFPVPIADQFAHYIYFEPIDWENGTNFNNDFLVWQATIERRKTPEPGTLGLLAAGLLGLVLARRRLN